jgi:DNA-directed RNA polymerase subunit RPC12/RpoP
MKCLTCGFESEDSQDFIIDYRWDDEADDELSVLRCPNCGEDDENKIEDTP